MDFNNFAYGSVLTAPSPATSGTSLVLQSGEGLKFPNSFPYNIVIFPSGDNATSTNAEIVTVTAITSDTLTIIRAREGTSARTIVAGDQVMLALTKQALRDLEGHYSIVLTDFTLSNVNTAQDCFPAAQNAFTAEADTIYEFEIVLDIRTGGTSHSTGFSLAGTATTNMLLLHARGFKGGVNATVTATNGSSKSNTTNYAQTPANTTANTGLYLKGLISVDAGGTIIPQITFSAAPGTPVTMKAGSFCKIRKVCKDTVAVIGDWS